MLGHISSSYQYVTDFASPSGTAIGELDLRLAARS